MSTKILKIALFDATGTPGIGEVVYGTRQQLLLVARNWRMERDNCRGTGRCRYQHREEGVILDRFKVRLNSCHSCARKGFFMYTNNKIWRFFGQKEQKKFFMLLAIDK